jgi:DNA-binding NtrC family response regulator
MASRRASRRAMVYIWEYDWLQSCAAWNMVERLVVLSEDGRITVENLPPNIRSFISDKRSPRPQLTEEGIDLNAAVEEFEFADRWALRE